MAQQDDKRKEMLGATPPLTQPGATPPPQRLAIANESSYFNPLKAPLDAFQRRQISYNAGLLPQASKAEGPPSLTPPAGGGVTYGEWKPLSQETLDQRKSLDAKKLSGSHLPDPSGAARPEAAAIAAAGGMDAYKAGLSKDYDNMQRAIDQPGQAQQMVNSALAARAGEELDQEMALSKIPVVGEQLLLPGSRTPVFMYNHDKGSADYNKYGARTYTDGSEGVGKPKQEGMHIARRLDNMTIDPTGTLVDPQSKSGGPFITNDPAELADYDRRVGDLRGAAKEWHDHESARQAQVVANANQYAALKPAREQLRKTMQAPGNQRIDYDKTISQLYPPQAQTPSWGDTKRAEFQANNKAQEQALRQLKTEMAKERMKQYVEGANGVKIPLSEIDKMSPEEQLSLYQQLFHTPQDMFQPK